MHIKALLATARTNEFTWKLFPYEPLVEYHAKTAAQIGA